jgi:hypothetical protein
MSRLNQSIGTPPVPFAEPDRFDTESSFGAQYSSDKVGQPCSILIARPNHLLVSNQAFSPINPRLPASVHTGASPGNTNAKPWSAFRQVDPNSGQNAQ